MGVMAVTARGSLLTGLWTALVISAALFFIVALLGFLFRSWKCWGIAVFIAIADLALATAIGLLDRLGFAR